LRHTITRTLQATNGDAIFDLMDETLAAIAKRHGCWLGDDLSTITLTCRVVQSWVGCRVTPATMLWAWLVRNCFQVGPTRCGAGSMPAEFKILCRSKLIAAVQAAQRQTLRI
jgi:hypothetical protein